MAHLNLSYIKENISDDPAFIRQVLEVFLKNINDDLDALHDAVANGDHSETRLAAHKVKSSFRNLGMEELTEAFETIEQDAKSEMEMDSLKSSVEEVNQVVRNAVKEVQQELDALE